MADIDYIDGIVLPDGTEVDILRPLKEKVAEQETLLQSLDEALKGLMESIGNAADSEAVSNLFEQVNAILSMKADSETLTALRVEVIELAEAVEGKADASGYASLSASIQTMQANLQSINSAIERFADIEDVNALAVLVRGVEATLATKAEQAELERISTIVNNATAQLARKADVSVTETLQAAVDQINTKVDMKAEAEDVERLMEHVITLQGIANKNTLDINGLAQRVTELAEQGIDTDTITAIITDYIRENGIRDTDTTYSVSIDSGYLILTPSSGDPQRVKLPATGYTRPAGGIPKEDLSYDVQQSLARADNAVTDVSNKAEKSDVILLREEILPLLYQIRNMLESGETPENVSAVLGRAILGVLRLGREE